MINANVIFNNTYNYYMLEIGRENNEIVIDKLKNLISEYNIFHINIKDKILEISFLEELKKDVRKLIILNNSINNFEVISNLSNLEYLRLEDIKKSKLDFSKLKKLKELTIKANGNISGLECLSNLEILEIYSWKTKFGSLIPPKSLKKFELIRFDGQDLTIFEKANFNELGLFYMPKIESLNGIFDNKKLKKIKFQSCKRFKNYEEFLNFPELEEIIIEDCGIIESIQSLKKIPKLKKLEIIGNNDLKDKDINFIKDLDEYFVCGEIGGKNNK